MDKTILLLQVYLVGESLDKDGHEEVEEDIVAEGHEGHKVEGGPVGGALHTRKQHDVPVLLGQHLHNQDVFNTGAKYRF